MADDTDDAGITDELAGDVSGERAISLIIAKHDAHGPATDTALLIQLLDGEFDATVCHFPVRRLPRSGGAELQRARRPCLGLAGANQEAAEGSAGASERQVEHAARVSGVGGVVPLRRARPFRVTRVCSVFCV